MRQVRGFENGFNNLGTMVRGHGIEAARNLLRRALGHLHEPCSFADQNQPACTVVVKAEVLTAANTSSP